MEIDNKEFIAWLKEQPAEGTYDYGDLEDCPIAQFLKSKGYTQVTVGGFSFSTAETGTDILIDSLYSEVLAPKERTRTFGAALKRAEELLT